MSFAHIPKVELHCHLDGIVDPAMLRAAEHAGLALPLSAETLEAAYPVRTFDEFVRWMRVAEALEGDLERFKPVLAQHLERLQVQHVIYTEITLGSSELPKDPVELLEKLTEFRAYVNALEAGRIQAEFLVVIGRSRPPEAIDSLARRLLPLRERNLIVGVAVAGWPEQPVRPFARALAALHAAGFGIEIHAGEWAGPEAVWDALEHGRPHRIGHGVAAFADPRLIERIREQGIHLEMCPTSNLKTGSVERLARHPVGRARDLNLSFSVSTDDPGAFECSLESEYELLAATFGFQQQDFRKMAEDALRARFQPELRYRPEPPQTDE